MTGMRGVVEDGTGAFALTLSAKEEPALGEVEGDAAAGAAGGGADETKPFARGGGIGAAQPKSPELAVAAMACCLWMSLSMRCGLNLNLAS